MMDVRGVRGGWCESGLTWKDEDGLYDDPKNSSRVTVEDDPEGLGLLGKATGGEDDILTRAARRRRV